MSVVPINSDQEWDAFVEKNSGVPIVLMYSASWCGPCQRIYPEVASLAKQYLDKIAFAKVDVDRASETAKKEQITSMPTFRFHSVDGTVKEVRGADKASLIQTTNFLAAQHSVLSSKGSAPSHSNEPMAAVVEQRSPPQSQESVIYDIEVDDQWNEFVRDVREAKMPLVLQFGTNNNYHCSTMRKVFNDASKNYSNQCVFARVNSDGAPRVFELLCNGIQDVPFYTAYDGQGNPIGQFQGARQGKFIDLVHKAVGIDTA